ncbi:MAG: aminoacyl-tRNA hydrolase [Stappia sp.]|jgi:PTH1 family peptidyl-tRNA hydrolase|uniref:aminoacyl-tRNA hydrolase n=1 Tax=Stappia sp. TaxID=1870903 RepID=UPI000C36ADAD|nr:aminoacyl-tRNA hydrolase [Stappia sp.]MAB00613.1 aminoacyl-tRNA hydrolase [Stappia sp.]MBM18683.1 aminoacyl-tRNA hydrolase [Stappia sp.]
MRLIVGLGNPGARYARNRHNIGFLAVDEIHRAHPGFGPWRNRFQAEVSEGTLGGEKVLLVKPQTFMNESGRSVGEALRFYKGEPADVLVIYDELDLPPARFRMKAGGGHGGHNGLRSITAHIGDAYRRLRLGIGHPGDKSRVTGHVLGDFAKVDDEWLEPLLSGIADHAALLAAGQDNQFANKLTLQLQPEKAQRPDKPKKPAGTPGPARPAAGAKGQSHIRQARPQQAPRMPSKGPMADMLRKLLGNDDGKA